MRLVLLLLALGSLALRASPFQAVLINDDDVARLGGRFPFPRRQFASAVSAAEHAGARAIVLKFFFDRPAPDAADDAALERAIRNAKISVILQANLESSDGSSAPLPPRLIRTDLPRAPGAPAGDRGWLPVAVLAKNAAAIGFIDRLNPAPLVECYRGQPVPSLFLVTLELVLGKATFANDRVTMQRTTLPLRDGALELPYPTRDDLKPISFSDLLGGKADERIKDSVVILGYDGGKMHTFPTPIGPIKAHRLFLYELELAYAAFTKEQ